MQSSVEECGAVSMGVWTGTVQGWGNSPPQEGCWRLWSVFHGSWELWVVRGISWGGGMHA